MILFLFALLKNFLIQIFVQKMSHFTICGSKKNCANGEKAVSRARKTFFFFAKLQL